MTSPRRAELNLDPKAAAAANAALWKRFPELKGRQLTGSSADARYRKYWMDAYLAQDGAKQASMTQTPPASATSECPGQPSDCGQAADAYQLQAEDRLASAGSGTLARNAAITQAYADMYFSDPNTHKWAGMAAFASCKVGEGMREAQAAQSGWKAVGGRIAGVDGEKLENALKAGNDAVYGDIYWQHLAYKRCGIAELEKAYADGKINKDVLIAWKQIDLGRQTGDQELVWGGNEKLLRHEQRSVLQEGVYDKDRTLWRNASGFPASLYREIDSPIPGDSTSFQDHVSGGDIGDFSNRWRWIEESMLPEWKKLDQDPDKVREKLTPCLQGGL